MRIAQDRIIGGGMRGERGVAGIQEDKVMKEVGPKWLITGVYNDKK